MLTSFFSNSKPINFVIVAVYTLLFYGIANFNRQFDFSILSVLKEILVLLLFLMSMIVLNFIAKKNELTQRNSYKILFFGAFASMFFAALQNNDIIISNFFILLALRRIISLKSQKETKKKVFDAVFWICLASIFYFWSVLFLLLVFLGVFTHVRQNLKYWLIPFVAMLTVLSLATCTSLIINDDFYTFHDWYQEKDFDFTVYSQPPILIPVIFLTFFTFWTSAFYIGSIQRVSANLKSSLVLVLLALMIALAIVILGPTKNSSEFLYFLAPLSIIGTNYFQILENKWIKETFLFLIVLMPFILWIWF